ncbi:MAG: hypothetical protein ABII79_07190 [bacterium]
MSEELLTGIGERFTEPGHSAEWFFRTMVLEEQRAFKARKRWNSAGNSHKQTGEKTMKRSTTITTFLVAAFLAMAVAPFVNADVPKLMSYQGLATDAITGNPVPDGNYRLDFCIYDLPGTVKWGPEIHPTVAVTNGLFSVTLGQGTPADPVTASVFSDPERYLGITVGTWGVDPEISPRTRLTTVPYAFWGAWDGDWELGVLPNDDILFTQDNWGIARFGASLLGSNDFTHVNLGVNSSTGSTADNPEYVTIGGGFQHVAEGEASTISGGYINKAYGHFSAIAGGYQNLIGSPRPPVAVDSGRMSFIGAGAYNYIEGKGGVIGGGSFDTIFDEHCFIGGGAYNVAGTDDDNISNANNITISGGLQNHATAHRATIGGGRGNEALGEAATISGGRWNRVENDAGTVGGGDTNYVYMQAEWGTVGGGMSNLVGDSGGTIAGGANNITNAPYAFVGGGLSNQIDYGGRYGTIGGGDSNYVKGRYATVPGGLENTASGDFSFAAGQQATASNLGSFVWNDATGTFSSTRDNQFRIRATGGVNIVGDATITAVAQLRVDGSISIFNSLLPGPNGNTSLFFGQENVAAPTTTFGEWGIQYWPASLGGGGLNFWKPTGSGGSGFANNILFLDDNHNVGIGTASPAYPLEVSGPVMMEDAAAPSASTGHSGVYSSGGELFALDAAGNSTQLSPHDPATGEWIFYSKNVKTGRVVKVDMEKLVRKIEEITGESFLMESWEKE